jgi:hypothetical protein
MYEADYPTPRLDRIALTLGICMVIAGTFLQKFALPGSNGSLPLSVLLVPLIIVVGLARQVLELRRAAFVPFALLLVIGLCDFIDSNGVSTSLPSLALFAVAQCSLIFRFAAGTAVAEPLYKFFRNAVLLIALVGTVQFGLQFLIGPRIPFFLDRLSPGIIVSNFNVLNPLAFNSPIFKSNGFFLLEPSFFSQLIAVGIALEVMIWRNRVRLLFLALAALLSFSGTGIVMLVIFQPIYAIYKKQYRILIVACVAVGALLLAAEPLGLTALTSRIGELGSSRSSGWARFVSPFLYLQEAAFQGPWSFLLGHGPGSVEQIRTLDYQAFDPTWAKLIYEYGFLGFAAYAALFYSAFVKSEMPLRLPLGLTYVLLGGYLLNVSIVSQLAIMVVWTGMEVSPAYADDARSQGLPISPKRGLFDIEYLRLEDPAKIQTPKKDGSSE